MRRIARAGLLAFLSLTLGGCFSSPPQIISIEPNRGSTSVVADAPVTVVFDRAVTRSSVRGRFSIDPGLPHCDPTGAFDTASPTGPCRIVWLVDRPGFEFLHAGAIFAANTKYTFRVAAGVTDASGEVNSLDHVWDLTAAPAPAVASVSPSDGATGVPADAPISVSFSRAMAPTATENAITIDPGIPGTTVTANTSDKSRFVLVPGRLLTPGGVYTIRVAASATDDHGQLLDRSAAVTFTAAGLSGDPKAVVLAGAAGEKASAVYLNALGSASSGDPVARERLLSADRCAIATGCGSVPAGQLEHAYLAAALGPAARWVAVVVEDERQADLLPDLWVIETATGRVVSVIPGATLPAWSGAGRLAYTAAGEVRVLDVAGGGGAPQTLPTGDPLVAPPIWSRNGGTLLLRVAVPGSDPHLELATPGLQARYAVPGVRAPTVAAAISPDGSVLVARVAGVHPATWVDQLRAGAAPTSLPGALIPVALPDSSTLVAISQPGLGAPSLVRATLGGGTISLTSGPQAADIGTVAATGDGRRLGYLDTSGRAPQVVVMNGDGTSPLPVTAFGSDGLLAMAFAFSP